MNPAGLHERVTRVSWRWNISRDGGHFHETIEIRASYRTQEKEPGRRWQEFCVEQSSNLPAVCHLLINTSRYVIINVIVNRSSSPAGPLQVRLAVSSLMQKLSYLFPSYYTEATCPRGCYEHEKRKRLILKTFNFGRPGCHALFWESSNGRGWEGRRRWRRIGKRDREENMRNTTGCKFHVVQHQSWD